MTANDFQPRLGVWSPIFWLVMLFTLASVPAAAQSSSANISGTVIDQSKGAVPNATVRLINQATNVQVTTRSRDDGQFIFPDVQPGTFTIVIDAGGYKTLRKVNLVLLASEPLSAGMLTLSIGNVTEQVTVAADITPLQTTTASRSAVLDNAQMENLLVIGRDPMGLTRLNPGVVGGGGSSSLSTSTTPTVNGVNPQYNFVAVDGVPGNTRGGATFDTPPNMDAVQEVTMLEASYSAANGKVAGANFNFVTKSGTQQFHGGLYWYFRNEDLNANSWINKFNGSTVARPRYRYNTFGGTAGGPVYWPNKFNSRKNKLFFFLSMENGPITSPDGTKFFRVPTQAEINGDFSHTYQQGKSTDNVLWIKNPSAAQGTCNATAATAGSGCMPGNQIPAGSINPQGLALMQLIYNNTIAKYPQNYIADNPALTLNNYNYTTNNSSDKSYNQQIFRIDFFPTEKLHMFGRYNHAIINNSGFASTTNKFTWLFPLNYQLVEPSYAGNITYTFSPNIVNEFNVGFSGWDENTIYNPSDIAKVTLGSSGFSLPSLYGGVNPLNIFPNVTFGGNNTPTYGWDSRFPFADVVKNFAISDGVTWVWHAHTFKFGVDFEQDSYLQPNHNRVGTFDFTSNTSNPVDSNFGYSNAEFGNLNTYTQVTKLLNYDPVTTVLDFYAQDTWRIKQKLVLDYGIRTSYSFSQSLAVGNNFVPSMYKASAAPALYSFTASGAVVDPGTGNPAPFAAYAGLFVPNTGDLNNGILYANTSGYPSGTTYNQGLFWAPRVGFAYSATDKTVIRGHYGIFYNARSGSGQEGDLTNNAPSTNSPTQYYTSINANASNYYVNAGALNGPFNIGHALPLNMPLPYTEEASFGIQQMLRGGAVAEIAYVGTFTRHASRYVNINSVPYNSEFTHPNPSTYTKATATALPDNFFRPYPGFSTINMQQDDLTANYNSLQARITRRFHNGLEFGLNYTWSRSMDYGTCGATAGPPCSDSYNFGSAVYQNVRAWNYGPAGYDIRNNLAINYLYALPKLTGKLSNFATRTLVNGWQISGDMTYLSGAPGQVALSVTGSPNITGGGDGARVALACDPMQGAPHTFSQWFNTSCFRTPTQGAVATSANPSGTPYSLPGGSWFSPKVNFYLPSITNFDTALFKNFPLNEHGMKIQLRAETYNTFNHTQFNGVNGTALFNNALNNSTTALQSNNLGQLTQIGGSGASSISPRYMQLALRFDF